MSSKRATRRRFYKRLAELIEQLGDREQARRALWDELGPHERQELVDIAVTVHPDRFDQETETGLLAVDGEVEERDGVPMIPDWSMHVRISYDANLLSADMVRELLKVAGERGLQPGGFGTFRLADDEGTSDVT